MKIKRSYYEIFALFILCFYHFCTKETLLLCIFCFKGSGPFILTTEYINNLVECRFHAPIRKLLKLKPLIVSDINVYKIVYKTTINEEEINASGSGVCACSTW